MVKLSPTIFEIHTLYVVRMKKGLKVTFSVWSALNARQCQND